ncbi:macrolide family glycosyltransferase [Kitasatospora cathayae]|uniref:Glycosyltransferase n=1 Tax=Kitasatospora cathayae TaxID=3004092 RepID=A0ABY7PX25_9ACTN|nr:macrolide family glycosyltransferase [Kitasatospora sp. HUAS 3-15]WBP84963.1 glycosyltransferase [Kitasatospora sp. HUAS 3-15]
MLRKNLLFVTLTGHGHINPMLPLVEELVRRGHQVVYATEAGHAAAVTGAGARWLELPSPPPFTPPPVIGPAAVAGWLRHYFAALSATYPVLRRHCGSERVDAICYDTTNWPGRIAARSLGIPGVQCFPHLASNETYSLDRQLTGGIDADDPAVASLAADCAAFATEYGVPLGLADTMTVVDGLNLVFVPREFQPAADSFDGRFHFLGPSTGSRERVEEWSPRDPDAPLLYVSLGTVVDGHPDFYRACAAAVADRSWQVAMSVGGAERAVLGAVPGWVEVRSRFPQLAVLRRATAFVSHAGMNSVMEALTYGVGIVAVPRTPEQAANAGRLVELGLGERLDDAEPVSPEALWAAISRVAADPVVRADLAEMRRAVRRGGGAARGADLVEQYVR